MMLYVLVYKRNLVINGGITNIVGPFQTIQAATAWHNTYAPDGDATITAIYDPLSSQAMSVQCLVV